MFTLSGADTAPSEIYTGLKFITKDSVQPYLKTQSRYEGNASAQKLIEHTGAIAG
jgi:simple sugar transport system substrate-binding protein